MNCYLTRKQMLRMKFEIRKIYMYPIIIFYLLIIISLYMQVNEYIFKH